MSRPNSQPTAPAWLSWCATFRGGRPSCRVLSCANDTKAKEGGAMEERFTESHEWIRLDGAIATVGITKYAAEQLGDVVFVELPEAGKRVKAGAEAAVVESVKAASEIYAPIAGKVTESN